MTPTATAFLPPAGVPGAPAPPAGVPDAPATTVSPEIATDEPSPSNSVPSEAVSFAVWVMSAQPLAGLTKT